MRGQVVVQKKGGKGKVILAFILGILLGIIMVFAAVGGAVYFALNGSIDSIFGMAGLDNGKGEDGRNKYVNTDTENGGAKTVLELVQKIIEMAGNYQNLTIGEIDKLVPATHGLVEQLLNFIGDYVEVSYDELSVIKFSEFGPYVQDLVLDLQPAKFIDATGTAGSMQKILEMVLYGVEANYVESPEGDLLPLYVDNFKCVDGHYFREEDDARLPASLEQYIIDESAGDLFDVFYYYYEMPGTEMRYFVAERDSVDVTKFYFTAQNMTSATAHNYSDLYSESTAEATGNYYNDKNGVKQVIEPITIRSLMYGGTDALNKVLVVEMLGEDGGIIADIFGDTTLGQLISGDINLDEMIENLKIPSILDISADQPIIAYLGYGITDVKQETNDTWSAKYKDDYGKYNCTVKVDDGGYITSVSYVNNEGDTVELGGTTVGEISDRIDGLMNDMTLGELLNITDDSNIILNAIKDATINTIDETIQQLTLNELYADEAYKNPAVDGSQAKRRRAVSAEEYATLSASEKDECIIFDKGYLYYVEVDGSYKYYNYDNSTNGRLGKLDSLSDAGQPVYTYGKTYFIWRLLFTDKVGDTDDEKALDLNGIAGLISDISSKIMNATLYELDELGIIDFEQDDLDLVVDNNGTPGDDSDDTHLGDLKLNEALDTLIDLVEQFGRFMGS